MCERVLVNENASYRLVLAIGLGLGLGDVLLSKQSFLYYISHTRKRNKSKYIYIYRTRKQNVENFLHLG